MNKFSLCGFSGGAKVALVAGMNEQGIFLHCLLRSRIAPQQISALPPALGFAGVRDLNYTEVIETDEALQEKEIFSLNSKVEW